MIGAGAVARYEVAIVLQHVEFVAGDNALEFDLGVRLGSREAQIRCASNEGVRLPSWRRIRNKPVSRLGVIDIESARFGVGSRLRPIDPDAELEPASVGFLGYW